MLLEIDTEKVREIYIRSGMQQKEISARCGMKSSRISAIVTGRVKKMQPHTLNKFAKGLGCEIDEIIRKPG